MTRNSTDWSPLAQYDRLAVTVNGWPEPVEADGSPEDSGRNRRRPVQHFRQHPHVQRDEFPALQRDDIVNRLQEPLLFSGIDGRRGQLSELGDVLLTSE